MSQAFTELFCPNNHNKPITKVRLIKNLTQQERLLCDLCEEQKIYDQILDITNVQLIISDFKKRQKEQIEIFTLFKLQQTLKIESEISQLKTTLIRLIEKLENHTKYWRDQINFMQTTDLLSNFNDDVEKLIENQWDDELKEYYLNFEEKNSQWIQKMENDLGQFQNFKESQNIKSILKESIILKDISPVRVKDSSISLNLISNTQYQNETCNAISINKSGTIIASSNDCFIVIWEFINGKMKFLTQLDRHMDYVTCLVFSKNMDSSLISASQDKTILCWQMKNQNQWICSQLNFQHDGPINCVLLNQNENQLLSGSCDQKILIWNLDLNLNKLTYSYQLQLTAGDVEGLTMNPSETVLVSSQINKSILIWKKGSDDKWKFSSTVTKQVDEYVSRILFLNNTSFIWVSGEKESLDCIFVYQEQKGQFQEDSQLRISLIKNNKEFDFHLFPIIYNQKKNIIIVKHKTRIYIVKEYPDQILKIAGVITCKSTRIFGSLTNDGQFLIYWDANGREGGGGQYFIYQI